MKLSNIRNLILEMFDAPNLNGVDISKSDRSVTFRFSDPRYNIDYEVDIYRTSRKIFRDATDDFMVPGWAIYLEADGDMDLTGKNNFGLVYGKLIASLKYLLDNYPVEAFYFSGAISGMDIIYSKLMRKYLSNEDPTKNFIQVEQSAWVSLAYIQSQPEEIQLKFQDMLKDFNSLDFFKKLKKSKNYEKRREMNDNTLGSLYLYDDKLYLKIRYFNGSQFVEYGDTYSGHGIIIYDVNKQSIEYDVEKIPNDAMMLSYYDLIHSSIDKNNLIKLLDMIIKLCDLNGLKDSSNSYKEWKNKLLGV